MKRPIFLISIILMVSGCSKNINFSPEHMKQTTGRYLFDQREVVDVFYDHNDLYIKWKGITKKPVVLDETTFFVADIYKKLRFVEHPDTKKRYLGVVSENDDSKLTFEYPKVDDDYKTPKMHLNDGEYDAAVAGFLELKDQDSTKVYIEERDLNNLGYNLLKKNKNDDAITVFKMNVTLFPNSDNVYDSLGEAYLVSGDSLQAYNNYRRTLKLNPENHQARKFVDAYTRNINQRP